VGGSMSEKYFKGIEAGQAPPVLRRWHWWIIRVDGRAFHTFTKHMQRPFDHTFMAAMDRIAEKLCGEIQNTRLAYVQSDEISVIAHAEGDKAQTWFGGDRDKVVSISAAIASAQMSRFYERGAAQFDSRVSTTPDKTDVERYLHWRQQDAFRNAVSMTAETHFPSKALVGKNVRDRMNMLLAKGVILENIPEGFQRGRIVMPHHVKETVTFQHRKTGEWKEAEAERRYWRAAPAPWFEDEPVL